jgi:hypothetical protein
MLKRSRLVTLALTTATYIASLNSKCKHNYIIPSCLNILEYLKVISEWPQRNIAKSTKVRVFFSSFDL